MKHSVRFGLIPADTRTQSIRVRVSWGGSRLNVRLGMAVEPSKWDAAKGRMKSGAVTSGGIAGTMLNAKLGEVETAIAKVFQLAQVQGRSPSVEEVRQSIYAVVGKTGSGASTGEPMPQGGTIFPVLAEFVAYQAKQKEWTKASFEKFHALGEHLRRYSENLSLSDFNEYGIQGFVDSLHREGLRNTTIYKTMYNLRMFLRWCNKRGLLNSADFETYRPRLRGGDGSAKEVIYLEWEELMRLYEYQFTGNHRGLASVRDVFCFQCFTGLRYSDVAKLKKEDVNLSAGYFTTVTKKTVDSLKIELNKYSRAILERYANEPIKRGLALPVISNVKMNVYLKEVGKMVGIDAPQRVVYFKGATRYEEIHPKWELLTTHCGRRTFVVNALMLGIPAEVIMSWTGHKDYKAMRPYIKIVDTLKASEMEKFNK